MGQTVAMTRAARRSQPSRRAAFDMVEPAFPRWAANPPTFCDRIAQLTGTEKGRRATYGARTAWSVVRKLSLPRSPAIQRSNRHSLPVAQALGDLSRRRQHRAIGLGRSSPII